MGSMTGMQARGPVLGGQFAVWGGLFACCDCSLTAIRQKIHGILLYLELPREEFLQHGQDPRRLPQLRLLE